MPSLTDIKHPIAIETIRKVYRAFEARGIQMKLETLHRAEWIWEAARGVWTVIFEQNLCYVWIDVQPEDLFLHQQRAA